MNATPRARPIVTTSGTTVPSEVKSPSHVPSFVHFGSGPSGSPVASRSTRSSAAALGSQRPAEAAKRNIGASGTERIRGRAAWFSRPPRAFLFMVPFCHVTDRPEPRTCPVHYPRVGAQFPRASLIRTRHAHGGGSHGA